MLYVLFVMSGFAALLYQVVWQRALFVLFGVNVESVAMVVAAFLLGLGGGALLGGALSVRYRTHAARLFGLFELGIAGYGASSLPLFAWVGQRTALADGSVAVTSLTSLFLLLPPTLLMGATLPLLVAHTTLGNPNVGRSVGLLYFANTLGSAAASFVAVTFLLGRHGQSGTVLFAVTLNVAASLGVLALGARRRARAT
jgi:hypothetical protein